MFLLSLIATYQVCTVSLKAGLYTYNGSGAGGQPLARFVRSSPPALSSSRHNTPTACADKRHQVSGERFLVPSRPRKYHYHEA
jgi:hypothetical protein